MSVSAFEKPKTLVITMYGNDRSTENYVGEDYEIVRVGYITKRSILGSTFKKILVSHEASHELSRLDRNAELRGELGIVSVLRNTLVSTNGTFETLPAKAEPTIYV